MIDLSQEIPILYHTGVYTLLQDALVEVLASCRVIVLHILAHIRVDYIVKFVVVGARVVVIVGTELIEQLFFFVIEVVLIGWHIGYSLFTLDQSSSICIDQLPKNKDENFFMRDMGLLLDE